jgi:hypothetical protein
MTAPAPIYAQLHQRALSITPREIGIVPSPSVPNARGVLMVW